MDDHDPLLGGMRDGALTLARLADTRSARGLRGWVESMGLGAGPLSRRVSAWRASG